jgi:sec-independent protein translocase protein TatA
MCHAPVRGAWHGLPGVPAQGRGRASLSGVGIENPVHLMFLAAVALVVLGPKRLPELTRAAGKSIREFREALNGGVVDEPPPVGQLTEPEPEREPE